MGLTSDIGEDRLTLADQIIEKLGLSDDDLCDHHFGWCYRHDNNTLFDWCSCHDGEHDESLEDFVKRAFDWLEDWLESDMCERLDWEALVQKVQAMRQTWGSSAAAPPNRAMRRAAR